jgi:molybdenum cofactor cytidylyltransferase
VYGIRQHREGGEKGGREVKVIAVLLPFLKVVPLRFAAVVLAAGKSQRMGRNKLLLKIAERTLLDHVLDALEGSKVDEVFVVLGHRPEGLKPIIEPHNVGVVLNPDYEEGMTSSVKSGLGHVTADAVFIVLGDQIGLGAELLNRMSALMESDPEALIVSPVYEGKRGHPVLIRSVLFPEILALEKEQSLREVVLRHEASHRFVEGSIWSIMDMDTPEDFGKAKRLWSSMSY